MNHFSKNSLPYLDFKNHWQLFQKDSRRLSLNSFYSKPFRQTLAPHKATVNTLDFSEELANNYNLYQLLLFHFQKKRVDEFFELIEKNWSKVNHYFQTFFRAFLKHKKYKKMFKKQTIRLQNLKMPIYLKSISNVWHLV